MSSDMNTEIWKDIPGYEGIYQVSNLGRVRSLDRWRGNGYSGYTMKGCLKKQSKHPFGYLMVGLNKDAVGTLYTVHTLVLTAFVGPCPEGMQACHFPDRDPTNNRLDNLMWGTPTTNASHRESQGKHNKGSRHGIAKLNEEQVLEMRRLYKQGRDARSLSRQFNVSHQTACNVVNRTSWTHI